MAEAERLPSSGIPEKLDLKLKYGWPFPDMKDPPLSFRIKSNIIIPLVGTFSKILLHVMVAKKKTMGEMKVHRLYKKSAKIQWCNSVNGHNVEQLQQLVGNRPSGTPLVTVSNHYSCIDDPALWGLLRWRELWSARKMRWSPAAHDIAFTRQVYSWFFSHGKCVPIIRGLGVYQQAMDFMVERLKEGQWVHIFPEGKVNMSMTHIRLKWGVGRLVYDSPVCPIVLPFYHIGMDRILPNQAPYIPRMGKTVTVVVGDPMDFKELVSEMKKNQEDPATARKVITDKIQEELEKLRNRAEELHANMLSEKY